MEKEKAGEENKGKEKEDKNIEDKEENKEKKHLDNKEEKTENKKVKDLISKESKTLIWMALVLIVVFFSSYYAFKSFNSFEYRGLQFTKQKIGEIPYFQSYYYFKGDSGKPIDYLLNLRIDPRENNVSTVGEIKLPDYKILYLSANETGFESCPAGEKAAAVSSFVLFLKGNGVDVRAASPDQNISIGKNITYANCENRSPKSVILIKSDSETKIDANGNCFVIDVSDCRFLQAFEKFEVELLVQAKERGSF